MEDGTDYVAEVEESLEMLQGPVFETGTTNEQVFMDSAGRYVAIHGGPWIKIHTSFRTRLLAELQGSKLSVFLCVSLHIDDRNKSHPTIKTIGEETGYSEREIVRAIQELEQLGLINVSRRHRQANNYTVNSMVAYGAGNNPIGETLAAEKSPKTLGDVEGSQLGDVEGSPRRTNKKEPYIPPAEKTPAATSDLVLALSIPDNYPLGKYGDLTFRCDICGGDPAHPITWENAKTPCCDTPIAWTGNKRLAKRLKAAHADDTARQKRVDRHKDPAVDFAQQLCGAKASPDEVSSFVTYVERNGLDAFKAMCLDIHGRDKETGMFGRGILKHIANAAPGYGKSGHKQKSSDDRGFIPFV